MNSLGLRTGDWSKDTLTSAGHGNSSFICAQGHGCGRCDHQSDELSPRQEQGGKRGTQGFPRLLPTPFSPLQALHPHSPQLHRGPEHGSQG